MPGYDNALTREWLFEFLNGIGVERGDGAIVFSVEEAAGGLRRIVADFRFNKERLIDFDGERIEFGNDEALRLFFSWRFTCQGLAEALLKGEFRVMEQWVAPSGEEGVFLARRA